jgi:hypothetical protein
MEREDVGYAVRVHKREGKRMNQEDKEFKLMLVCSGIFLGFLVFFAILGVMAFLIRFVG